jgi:hypothetical protein
MEVEKWSMKNGIKRVSGLMGMILIVAVFFCFGQAAEKISEIAKKVDFTGYGSYQFGQIVQGSFGDATGVTNIDHYWSHEVYAGVGFHASVSERFNINAGLEGKVWHPFSLSGNPQYQYHRKYNGVWLDQGNGTYKVGDTEKPWLTLTLGYFKYKYNSEARNLGEQLFRSVAYPGIIMNYFDFPAIRLLGLMGHFDLLNNTLKADAMVISESDWEPFGDFSFAVLARYQPLKVIDIGAGVEFVRLISVNEDKTTPPTIAQITGKDSIGNVIYGTDSSYYTFRATKVMGRLTLDLKSLFNLSIFGPEDGKIYGEIDVLGLQDYTFWYDDIMKRMPIMVGFNVPTFKLLDVLAIEAEYYPYPFQTAYFNMINNYGGPLPDDCQDPASWNSDKYKFQAWKWSVYVKRTVISGFSITAQLAHDHMHVTYTDGYPYWSESLLRPGQWWWRASLCYSL